MNNRLPEEIKIILNYAREEAIRLGNYTITADHLLLGILRARSCDAARMLSDMGVDPSALKHKIEDIIGSPDVIPYDKSNFVKFSPEVNNICSTVLTKLIPSGATPDSTHLLAAIAGTTNSISKAVLMDFGVDVTQLMALVSERHNPNEDKAGEETAKGSTLLDTYSCDLTKAARSGALDPVIGREDETERLAQILCRRKKNNPVLIGEPGVGKSAIVEGLAIRIAQGAVPSFLLDKRLVSLDIGSVVAGTKYRGQFEERIKAILKELRDNRDIILFIDEMHTLVGAGGAPGSLDAANMLKPALARGEIQCIGATTLDEYREIIEKDGALERRFQKIIVEPTDMEQTLSILEGIRERYEDFHKVRYSDGALRACIELSSRYITDRSLPDKAIDVLDEAGARAHIGKTAISDDRAKSLTKLEPLRKSKREAALKGDFAEASRLHLIEKDIMAEGSSDTKDRSRKIIDVTQEDIASVISMMTGIPVAGISSGEMEKLCTMEAALRSSIIGQDEAIEQVVRSIRRNRAGLKEPSKPVGTFLFLGPTGVGKTQLAKKLAQTMFGSQDCLIRIDMSEYLEKFAVSRLIGAPPGYVGYNEGGQLSEQVRRKPYSVVLLDEVEKAHPDIFNLLLQVLDEGRLTDANGRFIDFRNTILILTSNVGSRQVKNFGTGIGFAVNAAVLEKSRRGIIEKALGKTFSPEFLNRLDDIIYFNSLSRYDIGRIITIELAALKERLSKMGRSLTIDKDAVEFIADRGYDEQYGARPLKRAIQRYVEDPLTDAIISGSLAEGPVTISLNDTGDGTTVRQMSPQVPEVVNRTVPVGELIP